MATYDFRGTGRDVLLLHGGGRTSSDWEAVTDLLQADGYRVVAMDLRGHGDTAPAPWSFPAVLDDIATVVADLRLDRPAVIGHSLGGMVAALWAGQHADCPLAMNIDGHGNPTRPDQYAGLDDKASAAAHALLMGSLMTMAEDLSESFRQVMREVDGLDLYSAYRKIQCPLVVISGRGDDFAAVFPPPVAVALKAYVAWIQEQLAAAQRETPLLKLVSLPTGHDAHMEDPQAIADIIAAHVAGPEHLAGGNRTS
jgi:pimeloyl-ACP methyl ester carboxylesterase